MVITYYGGECFKISQGELALVLNPSSKMSADITLFSKEKGEVADKSGFVISGPGEYEIKGIFVKGFPDKTFVITFEGITLCLLGSNPNQEFGDIDILFVPADAYKSAVSLEPGVMIPMNYDLPAQPGKNSLTQFLKEAGETSIAPIDKFVVKKKDLEGKEGEIVLLMEE